MNKRSLVFVAGAFFVVSCVEQPQWPQTSALQREFGMCWMVALSDFQLLVQPISAERPIKMTLSPWPGEPVWATPVWFKLKRTLLSAPLPGQPVRPLPSQFRALYGGPFDVTSNDRTIGIVQIDGEWWVETSPLGQFTETGKSGWRRQAAEYSWADETFYTIDELASAFEATARLPDCQRVDWVSSTRAGNEARLRGDVPSPTVKPDGGE